MGSRFGKNKFNARNGLDERSQNTRPERTVKGEMPLLVFSIKDFDSTQCPPGQTFEAWERDGMLAPFMTKLVELSQKNRIVASQEDCITVLKFRKLKNGSVHPASEAG